MSLFGKKKIEEKVPAISQNEMLANTETLTDEQVDSILKQVDAESRTRTLSPFWEKFVKVVAISFTLFQLYTAILAHCPPGTKVCSSFFLHWFWDLPFIQCCPRQIGR